MQNKLPLTKGFCAIYLVASDKDGISASYLSKLIGVRWRTAFSLFSKPRNSMVHNDSFLPFSDIIVLDDAVIGCKKPGKREQGDEGKASVLFAYEIQGEKLGFLAIDVFNSAGKKVLMLFLNGEFRPYKPFTGMAIHLTMD